MASKGIWTLFPASYYESIVITIKIEVTVSKLLYKGLFKNPKTGTCTKN